MLLRVHGTLDVVLIRVSSVIPPLRRRAFIHAVMETVICETVISLLMPHGSRTVRKPG